MKSKETRPARKLPAHIARAIAVAANVDPKTVQAVIAGRPTRASTRDRILRALHEREQAKAVAAQLERQP